MKAFTYLGAFAIGWLLGDIAKVITHEPPAVPPTQAEVVRVLDVVVRDSNTTNHRQRFECRPAKEKR